MLEQGPRTIHQVRCLLPFFRASYNIGVIFRKPCIKSCIVNIQHQVFHASHNASTSVVWFYKCEIPSAITVEKRLQPVRPQYRPQHPGARTVFSEWQKTPPCSINMNPNCLCCPWVRNLR